jgi:hypothetical protein
MRRRELVRAALGLPMLALAGRLRGQQTVPPAGHGRDAWAPVFDRLPEELRRLLADPDREIQILCTRIGRADDGMASFHEQCWNVDRRRWFPAASLAKLPMALLACELAAAHAGGYGTGAQVVLRRPPRSGVWGDEPLGESLGVTLHRMLVVSENVPFNRCYELVGPDRAADRLQALGFADARLISRLGSFDAEANRRTVGVRLCPPGELASARPRTLWSVPARRALPRRFPFGEALKGRGWMDDEGRILPGPHDFSFGNFLPLQDLHEMLRRLCFPPAATTGMAWRLPEAMRLELLRILGRFPREAPEGAGLPRFAEAEFPDGYAKFFVVGDGGAARAPQGFRSYGKTGEAFGYLGETALLTDGAGNEVLLSAVIHCNADGIYNDDRYEYDSVGRPFLAALGRAVLASAADARRQFLTERVDPLRVD